MINTENYIKMSGKAKEIQKLWEPKIGDICVHTKQDGSELITLVEKTDNQKGKIFLYCVSYLKFSPIIQYFNIKDNVVWLPTQEQLQRMIKGNWICEVDMIFAFKYWIEEVIVNQVMLLANYTIKELWLAFVMYKKYDKIWNKEKWVEIGSQL